MGPVSYVLRSKLHLSVYLSVMTDITGSQSPHTYETRGNDCSPFVLAVVVVAVGSARPASIPLANPWRRGRVPRARTHGALRAPRVSERARSPCRVGPVSAHSCAGVHRTCIRGVLARTGDEHAREFYERALERRFINGPQSAELHQFLPRTLLFRARVRSGRLSGGSARRGNVRR